MNIEEAVEKVLELWRKGATAVLHLTAVFEPGEFLDWRVEVEEGPGIMPRFVYSYRLTHTEEQAKCTVTLPPPEKMEDAGALRKLADVLPLEPMDYSLPERVMGFLIELYGTYTEPAHQMVFESASTGGDYPMSMMHFEIEYREYEYEA